MMLKSSCRKIITLLLLLAFTSQTLATAAMTCELEKTVKISAIDKFMKDEPMDVEVTEDVAHHDNHMHHDAGTAPADADNFQDHHQSQDCCKYMGQCLLGGCALATANNSTTLLLNKIASTPEDYYSSFTPTPLATSLYRPPIFC